MRGASQKKNKKTEKIYNLLCETVEHRKKKKNEQRVTKKFTDSICVKGVNRDNIHNCKQPTVRPIINAQHNLSGNTENLAITTSN